MRHVSICIALALIVAHCSFGEQAESQYPTLNVAKLGSFKGETPYELHGDGEETRLKFVNRGPLPVVNVRINGGDEVTFFIDTGGSELFAKELGLQQFGEVQGTFSGGEQTKVGQCLGDWTVKNLPVVTLPFRQLSAGLGVKRIDGVIGTTLIYHFLATLDFPHGELVLRRKTAESRRQFAASSGDAVAVPIWMASDHFMVGWGSC
jgi:aspartyl protease